MTSKKITVTFAPGAFDSFEGTQEELDNLMAEIVQMAESGELMEQGELVDFDQLIEDDSEIADHLTGFMSNTSTRILQ
jgi:hypothetical protein